MSLFGRLGFAISPLLATQISLKTQIIFFWKRGHTTPLDRLHHDDDLANLLLIKVPPFIVIEPGFYEMTSPGIDPATIVKRGRMFIQSTTNDYFSAELSFELIQFSRDHHATPRHHAVPPRHATTPRPQKRAPFLINFRAFWPKTFALFD